jgi:hypothetical protein
VAGARFDAFGDTDAYTLCPPAVSVDGNVVFKTRLDQNGAATYGVFQWMGAGVSAVGLSDPIPDNLALSADDQPPYDLLRWLAGPSTRAYLMESHQTHSVGEVERLFQHTAAGPAPLVVPGTTPVITTGPSTLSQLFDYVLDGAGAPFVYGSSAGLAGIFAAGSNGLSPVALQGQSIPKPAAGPSVQGLVFGSHFTLMPDSAHGSLLFTADVAGASPARQGMFRYGSQGLETVMVEQLTVNGARDLTYGTLATSAPRQTVNGATAFATRGADGRWAIYRWRTGVTTLVAQEGQTLPGGGVKIVSLDPGPVLDLPPGSGPVFTLNDAGDVAFLATDGLKWGIYLFSDHP